LQRREAHQRATSRRWGDYPQIETRILNRSQMNDSLNF